MDTCGRAIDYLRISVTDRCNERCLYCMPEGYKGWERHEHHLTADEILRVVRVAADLGFRKVRVTGGEPLLRADLVEIVSGIASTPGIGCVGLSTNGTHLEPLAAPLKAAGLRTVNISLDALDAMVYRRITGGTFNQCWRAFGRTAAGFECIKLNCVLMRASMKARSGPSYYLPPNINCRCV